uniref:OB domain-containing protein n=1 Tax=Anopheles dirus TaxID=7168 RepID=A0A182N913_9DIPT
MDVPLSAPPKIKSEPPDDANGDVESQLPVYTVLSENAKLHASVEVVDLTEDEYMKQFKSFLATLPERRMDIENRKAGTNAVSKTVVFILSAPASYLPCVRMQQDAFICELWRIKFKNIMLCGRITAVTFKDDVNIYELDDGTGRVNVYHRQANNKFLDVLNKQAILEDLMRRKPSPLNDESIPDSAKLRSQLRLLLDIIKDRCRRLLARPSLRTRYFVIGQTFAGMDGKVNVFAHNMYEDAEQSVSCELFWKTHLLSIYEPLLDHSVEPCKVNETLKNYIDTVEEKLKRAKECQT